MLPHLHLYGLAWGAAALAWAACGTLLLVRGSRSRGPVSHVTVASLLLAAVGAAFAGARLHHAAASPELWRAGPSALVLDSGAEGAGLRITGGLLASLAVLLAFGPPAVRRRLTRAELLDAVVPPAGVAIAIGRLGCFADGCCFGLPAALPWATSFPPGSPAYWSHVAQGLIADGGGRSLPVHPLQLYLGLAGLVSFLASAYAGRSGPLPGHAALTFVAWMAALRLLLEPLRDTGFAAEVPYETQIDLVVLACALALLARRRQRRAADASAVSSAG
ncbi:MAG: prolipoprotein diacylglyceryl transferase family protein [Thermodesulfobacteriota bacterium]